jgi:lysine 2,3-aminomutase
MGKRNLCAWNIMKAAGQRTETPSSKPSRRFARNEEGKGLTLPFLKRVPDLSRFFLLDTESAEEIERVSRVFPFKIPEFYLSLMDRNDPCCPIRKQAIPSLAELSGEGFVDPLRESAIARTKCLLERHPGRAVFLAAADCAMYCRFCNRKRIVGKGWDPSPNWEEAFAEIRKDAGLQEIIVSGGDPFTLSAERFDHLLSSLKAISTVKIIRISTRIPVVSPERLRTGHLRALRKWAPLWVVVHINHPREVSGEFAAAIRRIREAGCPVVSQTVLLRGINDCHHVLRRLFEGLVGLGVKPYYLFQLDEVQGAQHFKVRLRRGMELMADLREAASGLAVPHYALDITGGLGKVPVDPRYLGKTDGTRVEVRSMSGEVGWYEDSGRESLCMECGICAGDGRLS